MYSCSSAFGQVLDDCISTTPSATASARVGARHVGYATITAQAVASVTACACWTASLGLLVAPARGSRPGRGSPTAKPVGRCRTARQPRVPAPQQQAQRDRPSDAHPSHAVGQHASADERHREPPAAAPQDRARARGSAAAGRGRRCSGPPRATLSLELHHPRIRRREQVHEPGCKRELAADFVHRTPRPRRRSRTGAAGELALSPNVTARACRRPRARSDRPQNSTGSSITWSFVTFISAMNTNGLAAQAASWAMKYWKIQT